MKGRTVRTPEKVAEAIRLRERGWSYKDIGELMGVSRSAVSEWLCDPDGSKQARRHARARGVCVDCGASTSWANGGGPSERCRKCAVLHARVWTREAIIGAIQRWAEETGGIPPAAMDWNPSDAAAKGHPERAERFYTDGPWPAMSTVREAFGTWNAAIAAAGFAPRQTGTRAASRANAVP